MLYGLDKLRQITDTIQAIRKGKEKAEKALAYLDKRVIRSAKLWGTSTHFNDQWKFWFGTLGASTILSNSGIKEAPKAL